MTTPQLVCWSCRTATVSVERAEYGYHHCPAKDCVIAWRRTRVEDAGLRLVNPHKQGFFIVFDAEAFVATGRNNGRVT